MKILIISLSIIVVLFIIFQTYLYMMATKTASQPYTVMLKGNDFEIRQYPVATMARVTSHASKYSDLANSGFGTLANYIFGGNETSEQIAMTSPVHMDINDSLSSMSFVMPEKYSINNLPKPNDKEVEIYTTDVDFVAVITFDGFASDEVINVQKQKLKNALDVSKITTIGHYRFLGYNPPYQIFGRKNEVIVSINWDK